MAVTRRYQPSHPPGQLATYALDLSPMLPPGIGLTVATCDLAINTTPPVADTSILVLEEGFRGRLAWATLDGGTAGTDYLMSWTLTDSADNVWLISTLLLCAATS